MIKMFENTELNADFPQTVKITIALPETKIVSARYLVEDMERYANDAAIENMEFFEMEPGDRAATPHDSLIEAAREIAWNNDIDIIILAEGCESIGKHFDHVMTDRTNDWKSENNRAVALYDDGTQRASVSYFTRPYDFHGAVDELDDDYGIVEVRKIFEL